MAKNDSLSQTAYEAIYCRLLAGQVPSRRRVSENGLARELGMSRTPVREAIRRLTREGMLYQVPRSGTYVAQPDRRRLVEAYELRIYLESLAVAKAARLMSAADVAQLAQLVEQMRQAARAFRTTGERLISGDTLHQFAAADMQFHLLILRAADNRLLFRTVSEILMQKRTLAFHGSEHDLPLLSRVWLFHARVARAIRKRDARDARHLMRAHLSDSRRKVLAAFDRQVGRRDGAASPADLTAVVERLIERVAAGASETKLPTHLRHSEGDGSHTYHAVHDAHETTAASAGNHQGGPARPSAAAATAGEMYMMIPRERIRSLFPAQPGGCFAEKAPAPPPERKKSPVFLPKL